MSTMFALPDVHDIVALALAEDLGVPPERFSAGALAGPDVLARDVTSASAVGFDARFAGHIVCREDAIIAGLAPLDFGGFAAGSFFLYQSTLRPSGSVYTKLAEFPLTKS